MIVTAIVVRTAMMAQFRHCCGVATSFSERVFSDSTLIDNHDPVRTISSGSARGALGAFVASRSLLSAQTPGAFAADFALFTDLTDLRFGKKRRPAGDRVNGEEGNEQQSGDHACGKPGELFPGNVESIEEAGFLWL
jgi:hypothetical protein